MSREAFRRAISAKIHAVAEALRSEWEAIGGRAIEDLPADAYDAYAPSVVGLIERGADDAEIAELLASIETSQLGLAPRPHQQLLDAGRRIRAAISDRVT